MNKIIKKTYLIIVVCLFILAVIAGIVDTLNNFEGAKTSYNFFTRFLESIRNRSDFEIFVFIFLNNSIKGLLSILLFFLFGIYSISMIVTNGIMIGSSAVIFSKIKGVSWFLAAILPHGIIEIPVFIITMAISLRLGVYFFQGLVSGKKNFQPEFKKALIFFAKYLLPLYFLAALIEAYLTPKIIGLFDR